MGMNVDLRLSLLSRFPPPLTYHVHIDSIRRPPLGGRVVAVVIEVVAAAVCFCCCGGCGGRVVAVVIEVVAAAVIAALKSSSYFCYHVRSVDWGLAAQH